MSIVVNCVSKLVPGCPKLVALSVVSGAVLPHSPLINAIVPNCSLLQRLRFVCIAGLTDDTLLNIAHSFPNLVHFGLEDCYNGRIERFTDVVSALPSLHTLVLDAVSEALLLEIAERGHPSLRILDTETKFTYAGLRQITAAMPQLTGLSIYDVRWEGSHGRSKLLEHCGGLERIFMGSKDTPATTSLAILDSVSAHCPNLHTLIADQLNSTHRRAIRSVVENCPRLRLLAIDDRKIVTVPPNRTGLVVCEEEYMCMDGWIPKSCKC